MMHRASSPALHMRVIPAHSHDSSLSSIVLPLDSLWMEDCALINFSQGAPTLLLWVNCRSRRHLQRLTKHSGRPLGVKCLHYHYPPFAAAEEPSPKVWLSLLLRHSLHKQAIYPETETSSECWIAGHELGTLLTWPDSVVSTLSPCRELFPS